MSTRRSLTPTRRRPQQSQRWLIVATAGVLVTAAFGLTLLAGSRDDGSATQPAPNPAVLGQRATVGQLPDLEFARLGSGEPDRLGAYEGRPLVINFFASWCTTCLAELPRFEQAYQTHKDQVTFLGLNLQDSPSSAARVVADTGLSYPIGTDPQGRLFQAIGAFGMPTTVFVAADGTVLERYTGELSAEQLIDKMQTYGMVTAGS